MAASGDGTKGETREARDRRIMAGLIAQEAWAFEEARPILRQGLGQIAKRRARWLVQAQLWPEWCQAVFALLVEWQRGGDRLRADESLWALTNRLAKQVAEGLKREVKWAQLAFSLEEHPKGTLRAAELDVAVTKALLAWPRYPNPERQAAACEQIRWIAWAEQKLAQDDRDVLDAVEAVEGGEYPTLGEALAITEAAAHMRIKRVRERLCGVAVSVGNRDMARRLAGKKYADALEMLFVAAPGADHRIGELMLLRDGELDTVKSIELVQHVAGCDGCKRTQRTIAAVDDALAALVLLPKLAFDFADLQAGPHVPKPRSRVLRWASTAVLAAAVGAAAAWWWRTPPQDQQQAKVLPPQAKAQPPVPPPPAVTPVPMPASQRYMMAPEPPEKEDAGAQ